MRLRSLCVAGAGAALAAVLGPTDSLLAAPPTGHVVAVAARPTAQWINHEVVPGERLSEIADRYAVSVASIMRWNRLDPNRPQFWAGEPLRVQTDLPDRTRKKITYIVRPSDTWGSVARHFDVDRDTLARLWNPREGAQPRVGHKIVLWVEPETLEHLDDAPPAFSLRRVAPGGRSVGWPDQGRLVDGVQIPENPALYTLRNLDHSYGSTHAIEVLQHAIADFRQRSGYAEPIVIWDMSIKHGGRFGPHKSHRSGRDVDIALPLRAGYRPGSEAPNSVDWDATWRLIRAFIRTGQVRYVFLSRTRQASLYKAARACGATPEELEVMLQYPRTEKVGIVRHSPGHNGHLHIRFTCGPEETDCHEI